MAMYTHNNPVLQDGERILADKGYCGQPGQALGLVAPFKERQNEELTEYEKAFNYVQKDNRVVIKRSFGFLKRFKILGGRYRGRVQAEMEDMDECYLYKILKVLVHLNYVHTSHHPIQQIY